MDAPLRRAALLASMALAACTIPDASPPNATRRREIADSLTAMIRATYDLSSDDVVSRLMSLYPDRGRVISASGGRVTTTRDSLQAGIQAFWEYVGRNMQEPRWVWGSSLVDVLSENAAVVTTTYRVPHRTPAGDPHTIGGAWTAVFVRRDGKWMIVQEHLSDVPQQILDAQDAAAAGGRDHGGHERRP